MNKSGWLQSPPDEFGLVEAPWNLVGGGPGFGISQRLPWSSYEKANVLYHLQLASHVFRVLCYSVMASGRDASIEAQSLGWTPGLDSATEQLGWSSRNHQGWLTCKGLFHVVVALLEGFRLAHKC